MGKLHRDGAGAPDDQAFPGLFRVAVAKEALAGDVARFLQALDVRHAGVRAGGYQELFARQLGLAAPVEAHAHGVGPGKPALALEAGHVGDG